MQPVSHEECPSPCADADHISRCRPVRIVLSDDRAALQEGCVLEPRMVCICSANICERANKSLGIIQAQVLCVYSAFCSCHPCIFIILQRFPTSTVTCSKSKSSREHLELTCRFQGHACFHFQFINVAQMGPFRASGTCAGLDHVSLKGPLVKGLDLVGTLGWGLVGVLKSWACI